jgi:isoaspartyl peptidase/L-asparaginase-like protein (Ntn-hydrolase superfamily)
MFWRKTAMTSKSDQPGGGVSRRDFVAKGTALSLLGVGLARSGFARESRRKEVDLPVLASTWPFGLRANEAGMAALKGGGSALDAVEQGVRVVEADESVSSVGYGGTPNADGVVQLDASIMDGTDMRCGGVAALRNIKHPVSVARKVMEKTPHVLLVDEGALKFARSCGFEEMNLLTDMARARWETWKRRKAGEAKPPSRDDHDTIGMIALDGERRLTAAVTTSGLGFKLPGRVGDSPLIGCGIYADATAGAAVSTGVGEEAIRVLGSFLVVEFMRNGLTPQDAIFETLKRVKAADRGRRGSFQLAFLAMTRSGDVAGAALQKGFSYALTDGGGRNEIVQGAVL